MLRRGRLVREATHFPERKVLGREVGSGSNPFSRTESSEEGGWFGKQPIFPNEKLRRGRLVRETTHFPERMTPKQKVGSENNTFSRTELIMTRNLTDMDKKVIIFSAPSGAGKSTIVRHLLTKFNCLEFSVSATSRAPRGQEVDGKDYYFFSTEEFENKIRKGDFVEYEEVYKGSYYGTLVSEVQRIWEKGNIIIFDIDVKGGVNLKRLYGKNALAVFIQPPSVEELRNRLVGRGTDAPEAIERRVAKAEEELTYADKFDVVLINDQLEEALATAEKIVGEFAAR